MEIWAEDNMNDESSIANPVTQRPSRPKVSIPEDPSDPDDDQSIEKKSKMRDHSKNSKNRNSVPIPTKSKVEVWEDDNSNLSHQFINLNRENIYSHSHKKSDSFDHSMVLDRKFELHKKIDIGTNPKTPQNDFPQLSSLKKDKSNKKRELVEFLSKMNRSSNQKSSASQKSNNLNALKVLRAKHKAETERDLKQKYSFKVDIENVFINTSANSKGERSSKSQKYQSLRNSTYHNTNRLPMTDRPSVPDQSRILNSNLNQSIRARAEELLQSSGRTYTHDRYHEVFDTSTGNRMAQNKKLRQKEQEFASKLADLKKKFEQFQKKSQFRKVAEHPSSEIKPKRIQGRKSVRETQKQDQCELNQKSSKLKSTSQFSPPSRIFQRKVGEELKYTSSRDRSSKDNTGHVMMPNKATVNTLLTLQRLNENLHNSPLLASSGKRNKNDLNRSIRPFPYSGN